MEKPIFFIMTLDGIEWLGKWKNYIEDVEYHAKSKSKSDLITYAMKNGFTVKDISKN